jgi:5'-methylthioadenosine phosphorylase
MCPELRGALMKAAEGLKIFAHNVGTYVCIEGPRFSTKAESKMHRGWGADVVGMTLVPECVLAREAEMCYACIATVTDYDVWKDHPVSAGEVRRIMRAYMDKVKSIISEAVSQVPKDRNCDCKDALRAALI